MRFGGGIALSAGSSQGSNAGVGGGSLEDACEISSDGSDGNGRNSGHDSCEDGCDDDDASSLKKPASVGTINVKSAKASKNHSTATSRCQRGSSSGCRRGRSDPGLSKGPGGREPGKTPTGRGHGKQRRKPSHSSLQAFERLISGEDLSFESLTSSPANKWPLQREGRLGGRGGRGGGDGAGGGKAGQGSCGDANVGGGGAAGDKGDGGDSDDCCEIMFTRVSRPTSTSSSWAQQRQRPTKEPPVVGKEVDMALRGSSPRTCVLSDLSEGDDDGADGESD